MKIERVSSSQIKVFLTGKDLAEYNLKIHELVSDMEKTKKFFREITQEAVTKFDFMEDDKPLMVEIMPYGNDSIVLIVSKLEGSNISNEDFSQMIPGALGERAFIRKSVQSVPDNIEEEEGTVLLYAFECLDDVAALCKRIDDVYNSTSTLYKEKNTYYLAVFTDLLIDIKADSFEAIMAEYGTRVISNPVSRAYFDEHSEIIIKDKAVGVLSHL